MFRALVPVLMAALVAAPTAAQFKSGSSADDSSKAVPSGFQSVLPSNPAPVASKPDGGVHAVEKPAGPMLDAAAVAAWRARHELAKANGQLCAVRDGRQELRLAQAEAQLAAQMAGKPSVQPKGTGGLKASGDN